MKLFKTDGIRGKYGEVVTLDLAFMVGYNLSLLGCSKVVVGYDTRFSSFDLKNSLISGAKFNGIDVLDLGLSTTPRVEYYSKYYDCFGVMITASHNPYYDNGIKVFKSGKKINNLEEERIENNIYHLRYEDVIKDKIDNIKFDVCLDLDNGGACFLKEYFGDNFHLINTNYDGFNINDRCGSLFAEVIKDEVIKNKYKCGFSFDGDADRVIGVDEFGNVLDGDFLAYYLARVYKYSSIVFSRMVNVGLINECKKHNIKVYLTDSGDKFILDMMEKNNVMIGSEASGHIIHRKYGTSGDGVLNALDIMECLSLGYEFNYSDVCYYPSELRNYNVDADINYLYEIIKNKFSNVIPYIRKSGTEGVLRVFLQAELQRVLDECFLMIEDELCKH